MSGPADRLRKLSPIQKGALVVAAIAIVAAVATTQTRQGGLNLTNPVPTAPQGTASTSTTALPSTTSTTVAATTISIATMTTAGATVTTGVPASSATAGSEVRVLRVVDGDTITVSMGGSVEEVRLIGIDAPEAGENFYREAANALSSLVEGMTVRLETDADLRDQYGRLLAYVWIGERMANEEMLGLGYATVYTVPPNVAHERTLQAAENQARASQVGVWGEPGVSPLEIVDVRYDPPGDDTKDLNQEYIVFRVLSPGTLRGYSVEDEAGHRYDFPDRVYQAGAILTLHSGAGTDTSTDLYWGASGSAIWNNDGDTVKVLDPRGRIVAAYGY